MVSTATRPRNPYIAGNPVGNSRAFVGRGDILRAVHRVLRDPERHGVVLYGQRRIGKTSILQHLVASLGSEAGGAYRPVYFDLQDKAKWSLGDVLVDQARGIAAALRLPTPVVEGDPALWFRSRWLPSVLAGLPAETSLVILLDEFDVLADVRSEHAASALFPYIRQLLDESGGRVRFIFVIGRNIDDLTNIAHALFKSLPSERVGLLAREDAEALMRMSEADGTMAWDAAAVDAAWALTSGHPVLLQQLCWELWERLHEDVGTGARASADDVAQVVSRTLDTARNIFEWIWKGLPPAERVVASALAGAGARSISQDALEGLLHESGVRLVMRELRDAPQILEDWDLIEPTEGGYRFRVELLRRWIAKTKPLNRVQKELDYVEPLAERYYGIAELHYKQGELDTATTLLRQALGVNPNHFRASELLADILIARQDWPEARRLLEQLHEHNPPAARGRLVQVLMALADVAEGEDERLDLLDRVLRVQRHAAAESARRQIWTERGDRAKSAGRLEEAVAAYQEAEAPELEKQVRDEMRRRELDEARNRPSIVGPLLFLYGNPVPPDHFIGRRGELRRIVSRLAAHGQSAVIIGEPRTGKTSLLAYIATNVGRELIASDSSARFVFSYLDSHVLPAPLDHAHFWSRALAPLAPLVDPGIFAACRAADFDPRTIEEHLFEHMRQTSLRLVLLVDEFDDLVLRRASHPVSFFGALRSLSSRAAGALALVAASRLPLEDLEREAQRRGYTGTPPFNFMKPEILGPFSEDDVETLLERGRTRFSSEDRRYVREVAGGHPYLTQAAAGMLWDAYEDGLMDPRERRSAASAALRRCSADILADIWEQWPAPMRLVFAAVTLEHLDALGGYFGFGRPHHPGAPGPLVDAVALGDELGELHRRGLITDDPITPSRQRVRPVTFLAWCAKELRKRAAASQHWAAWLREQGWESYLSDEQLSTWLTRVPRGLRLTSMGLDFLTGAAPLRSPPASAPLSADEPVSGRPLIPARVYLSYAAAPTDEALLAELEKHLQALEREGRLSTWSRRDVTAGEDWRGRVDENLRAADIVLLCVSADYVASDYCYNTEVALAMQRWRLGEAQVIPVVLRPIEWKQLPFGELEPLPGGGKAVSSWTNQDEAWVDVVQGIRRIVERLAGWERADRR